MNGVDRFAQFRLVEAAYRPRQVFENIMIIWLAMIIAIQRDVQRHHGRPWYKINGEVLAISLIFSLLIELSLIQGRCFSARAW